MNEHDHDAWDDSVRGWLLREARLERVPPDARRRLRRRLGLTVLASALTGTTAAASGGTRIIGMLLAKQAAAVALSMAIGASTGGAVLYVAKVSGSPLFDATPSKTAPAKRDTVAPLRDVDRALEPAAPPASSTSPEPAVAARPSNPLPPAALVARPSSQGGERESAKSSAETTDLAAPPIVEHDLDLTRERELLESARGDLTEHRFDAALQKIERHVREYPSGRLAPEREALAVQALVGASRYDEARQRGADFAARFPRSMFRTVVDATLRSIK